MADWSFICLTVDTEWCCPEILAEVMSHFDARGLKATFFCTHDGIDVGDHERGIHPNFRPNGDCLQALADRHDGRVPGDQKLVYRHVVEWFKAFAPEAVGVRAHSLHYDSQLMDIYRDAGLRYDSSYQLPLATGLQPFWKESDIVELPIYYNDYFDIKTGCSGFAASALRLGQGGLKVLNFHPNIIYLNADSEAFYLSTKRDYHDPERLRSVRRRGPGACDLFLRILDDIAEQKLPVATLAEINAAWRQSEICPWPGGKR